MVKKLIALAAMLIMVLLAAIPALAQHSDRAADRDVGADMYDVDRAPEPAAGNSATPVPAPDSGGYEGGSEDAKGGDFVAVSRRAGGGSVVPAPDASGGGSR